MSRRRAHRNPIAPSSLGRLFVRLPKGHLPTPGTEARYNHLYFVGPGDRLGWPGSLIVAIYDWTAGAFSAFNVLDVQEYSKESDALSALRSGRYAGFSGMVSPPYSLFQVDHAGIQNVPPRLLSQMPFELDLLARPGESLHAQPYDYPYSREASARSVPPPPPASSHASTYFGNTASTYFGSRPTSNYFVTPTDVLGMVLQLAMEEAFRKGGEFPRDPIPSDFPRKNSIVTHYAGTELDGELPYARVVGERMSHAVPPVMPEHMRGYINDLAYQLCADVKNSDVSAYKKKKMNTPSKLAFRLLPEVIRGDIRTYILDWKLADEGWRYDVQSESMFIV